ncbi:1-phosphatidylinositol phosphodiesterase [Geosmithia morbida]|uniref:1-phosphatidylinositol phosphodiesterase n=1 Tax=Geosmithia morbida TaxID=1094350 RepID=A0A9P4YZV1_9HYPO|nr:1-phosphatidylinositol phosphodiesterase [Geosmithia morbida]KAF4124064.1 1-phosphatidylinositol phosphodiesterase [Geosmithia morbida]
MADLTIRNLTAKPLFLIKVERFETEREQTGSLLGNMTTALTSMMNATEFQSYRVIPKGQPIKKHDADIKVDAFASKKTDVRTADGEREVIRLTLRTEDDRRYQIDVPRPDAKAGSMKRIGQGHGDLELTGVYVERGAVLAVFSSGRLDSWMAKLHDKWPLQILSIPGTHNSPTCYTALPSVRCQSVGVPEQLRNGVRFLDIRVSVEPNGDQLTLVHSAFPISLTGAKYLDPLLDDVYRFLDEHKDETVIVSLKREGTGKGTDEQMGTVLKKNHVDKHPNKWWVRPGVPNLGDARGRIVLVRRFGIGNDLKACHDGRGFGIDAQAWPDNCEDGRCGPAIRVQDFYEVSETQNVEKKIDFSRGQLERAAEQGYNIDGGSPAPSFFINFLTASNFFNANCWPERIAAKVNPAIVEYLCVKHGAEGQGPRKLKVGRASTGIVVTDWVGAHGDWDLVRSVVGMNARLQRPRGQ